MSAEVWFGRWPETGHEQDALNTLYHFLEEQSNPWLILTQFHPGAGDEIDYLIIKPVGMFLVEQKNTGQKLIGGQEGDWKIVQSGGVALRLHENPFRQLKRRYAQLNEWLEKNGAKITEGIERRYAPDYPRAIMSYIVVTPDLNKDSEISIKDTPIRAVGLENFMTALTTRTRRNFDLSPQEMARIPRLLGLEQWKGSPYDKTIKLGNASAAVQPFAILVARGHTASSPLFKLDTFAKEAITIGRDIGNDLIINDPTVSRQHARFRREGQHYVVEDAGSVSGTYVSFKGEPNSERRLEPGKYNFLKNNTIVRFGAASFTFLEHKGPQ